MDEYSEMARATLTLAGVEASPADLEVIGLVARAFEPGVRALDALDLSELPAESDLDPGRAPRRAASPAEL